MAIPLCEVLRLEELEILVSRVSGLLYEYILLREDEALTQPVVLRRLFSQAPGGGGSLGVLAVCASTTQSR